MITSEELAQQITGTIGKLKVLELTQILKQQQFALRDLIDLTFDADNNIAFRAAWLLENLLLLNPVFYLPETDYLLARIDKVKHPSCQRHYSKIAAHLTSPKAHQKIKEKMLRTDLEPLVEKCFDWMIDPKVKVAVKAFCSETLFNLCERYLWIKEELSAQLKFLRKNGSAAIQSKAAALELKIGKLKNYN